MKSSIIIASRNEGPLLKQTIDCMLNSRCKTEFDIIVADDGSTDGSLDFLTEQRYRYVTVVPTSGLGLANARNEAAKHAKTDFLIICDAHLRVYDGWIDGLIDEILSGCDAVCPTICDFADNPNKSILEQQFFFTYNRMPIKNMCGKTFLTLTQNYWLEKTEHATEIPLLPGGCFCIKNEVFKSVGGYSKMLLGYGSDEEELSIKLWTYGYVLKATPKVVVEHFFRPVIPYKTSYDFVVMNALYVALINYTQRRIDKVLTEFSPLPSFDTYRNIVFSSENIANLRNTNFATRKYSDDWFF